MVDVASAIIAALKDDGSSMGKLYELGGPEVFTVHQLVVFGLFSLSLLVPRKLLKLGGVNFY